METVSFAAMHFLAGVTLCGIAGSILELIAGARLSFAAPFFNRLHRFRFAFAVLTAGPLMLGNDALAAWREGRLALVGLLCCAVTVSIWALAIGVTITDTMLRFAA